MQLALPVSFSENKTFDTLVHGDNSNAIEHLKSLVVPSSQNTLMPSQRLCFIYGPQSSGKTHVLLAIEDFCSRQDVSVQYLNAALVSTFPVSVLEGLDNNQVLCIDNLHAIEANDEWQTAIFNLINQFLEGNKRLLLFSSKVPVKSLNFDLPDLLTRLTWGVNFSLKLLSDEHRRQALETHFQQLGVVYTDEAIQFLTLRGSRDMAKLVEALQMLDKASLESQRKITVPFVKSVLNL